VWLEGPGFGRGVRKPDPLPWVPHVWKCQAHAGGAESLPGVQEQAVAPRVLGYRSASLREWSCVATAANTEASNRYCCSCNRSSGVGLYQRGSCVLSCLIHASCWAGAPRWGGRLRCWLAAPLPLPQTWTRTCCAVQIATRVFLVLKFDIDLVVRNHGPSWHLGQWPSAICGRQSLVPGAAQSGCFQDR
jgi:hypothetical protein